MSQQLPVRRSTGVAERWEPFTEFEQVTERMRRMLEQTFGAFGLPSLGERAGWSPLVDIEETDDAYVVEAELPGVDRSAVNVELVAGELTISGEVKEPERTGTVRRRNRRTGRFEYRVNLPGQIDAEKIDARLADGVLTVRIPKSERAPRRKIEIKA
jgi:HSP20 family protein